ncbi:hypothetical protein [Robertmurraya andreesenii]|uniref:Uncharacterized protein n=1 Tax=Anoxybacillus andreesenii TaxID=1325932 RepID=A0ABT9V8Y4_9BACL|nr:hypothetical protein [Robertmurraya andreesenii]MDQ0157416.1 hypothetical protein [Robertmurraya andreesenii]
MNDNRLSDYLKEDIYQLAKTIEEKGQSDVNVIIYSPNLIEGNNTDTIFSIASYYQPPVYYTGYGSQRYKDEVLVVENYTSDTGETDFSNSSFAKEWYNKVLTNAAKVAASDSAQSVLKNIPYSGLAIRLVNIFGEDPYVGGSTGDKIKVYFIEDKWRKYTSIMYPSSDYKLGAISDQYWMDVIVDKIESGVQTQKKQSTFMRNADYLNTDKRAYEYKSSLGYWNNKTTAHIFYDIYFNSALK